MSNETTNDFYILYVLPARKLFPITFLGSIFWIAGFSYLMVWWATSTGDTFGIPDAVSSELMSNKQVPSWTSVILCGKTTKVAAQGAIHK